MKGKVLEGHVTNLAMLARLNGLEESNLMYRIFEFGEEEGLMRAIDEMLDRLSFENEVPWNVKITPQMTRFRDVKVCNSLGTDEIDDHRIQSDYNMNCNTHRRKELYTWYCVCVVKTHDTSDNVTTKTESTFHTKHMNIDT